MDVLYLDIPIREIIIEIVAVVVAFCCLVWLAFRKKEQVLSKEEATETELDTE